MAVTPQRLYKIYYILSLSKVTVELFLVQNQIMLYLEQVMCSY